MSTHARLSPSAAHRWMRCPGSVILSENIQDSSSQFAAEGSAAHYLAEYCYASDINPMQCQGFYIQNDKIENDEECFNADDGYIIRVDSKMCAHVQDYLSYIQELQGDKLVEIQVDISKYIPGSFGHVDCLVINVKNQEIHVVDLKYGMGLKVSAKLNEQLRLYALGAIEFLTFMGHITQEDTTDDFWTITTHVYQPRLSYVSCEVLKVPALIQWGLREVVPAAKACDMGGTFNPGGKQCQFCKAKSRCQALATENLETAKLEFEKGGSKKDYIDPHTLSNKELSEIFPKLKLITTWAKSVEQEVKDQLLEGNGIPGYKVVHGRSIRKWKDEHKAQGFLKSKSNLKMDDIFLKKFISPTQAEKVVKENYKNSEKVLNEVNQLVIKPLGKPTVVKESDKREAIVNIKATEEFSKIQE